nr:hypothetical protein CQW23_09961 [Ipomoea batatas]
MCRCLILPNVLISAEKPRSLRRPVPRLSSLFIAMMRPSGMEPLYTVPAPPCPIMFSSFKHSTTSSTSYSSFLNAPEKSLKERSRTVKLFISPSSVGIEAVSRFLDKLSAFKLPRKEISFGIFPVKLFALKSREFSCVHREIEAGISPVKLLLLKSMITSFFKCEISLGIFPENLLEWRDNFQRKVAGEVIVVEMKSIKQRQIEEPRRDGSIERVLLNTNLIQGLALAQIHNFQLLQLHQFTRKPSRKVVTVNIQHLKLSHTDQDFSREMAAEPIV